MSSFEICCLFSGTCVSVTRWLCQRVRQREREKKNTERERGIMQGQIQKELRSQMLLLDDAASIAWEGMVGLLRSLRRMPDYNHSWWQIVVVEPNISGFLTNMKEKRENIDEREE